MPSGENATDRTQNFCPLSDVSTSCSLCTTHTRITLSSGPETMRMLSGGSVLTGEAGLAIAAWSPPGGGDTDSGAEFSALGAMSTGVSDTTWALVWIENPQTGQDYSSF